MFLRVTAVKYVTILDPHPLEGVGGVRIQQEPGEYKEYELLPEQVHRLIPLLDNAVTAGLLTYTTEGGGGGGPGSDTTAIHVDTASEISGITEKVAPATNDMIVIESVTDGNAKRRVQIGNLPGGGAAEYEHEVDDIDIDSFFAGNAPLGSGTGALVWRIRKFVDAGSDIVNILYAEGSTAFTYSWDLRATYTYS